MHVESNKALMRAFFDEVVNKRNYGLVEEIFSQWFIDHDLPVAPGPLGVRSTIETFVNAFPDMHVELKTLVGEGEFVGGSGMFTGTHLGEFMGMPATGRNGTHGVNTFWRCDGGKAVEGWTSMDVFGILRNIGAFGV